jgi:hypothetical protein
VTTADKNALIHTMLEARGAFNRFRGVVASTEQDVKGALQYLPLSFHDEATRSAGAQPVPSDQHSNITSYQPGWGFEGMLDYFFISYAQRRITAVMDAKKPWKVTAQQISSVLDGTYLHHERVAYF